MAFQRPFMISLRREDTREPWGFRLDGGGVTDRPVTVQQVLERSLAERSGLRDGDQVIQVGRLNVQGRTLSEVQELIHTCKNRVEMFVIREDLLRNRKENEPLTVKAVVHSPYNSPLQLYSTDNVADTLATQAAILTDPTTQLQHLGPTSPPVVHHSNVLDALREQGGKGPRVNGEIITRPTKKKQPPPVPPKPRPPATFSASPPVRGRVYPGNMEQVQYQNYSTFHKEEQRTTQRVSNYEEYEEEEEETEEEEEEEQPVVVTQQTKTFKSQTSFTPQQSEGQRSEQHTQQIVRTQQTTQQREYQQQQQDQQRKAEIARQQQQAYEQQQRQLREQQQRQAYEQQQREQQAREQRAREQQAREREQQFREQQAREQRAREQQAREQQLREQQFREQQARERQAAQQRQAYEQQQAREAYQGQQRQAQLQAQQRQAQENYEQQQRLAQARAQQQRQPHYPETESSKKLTSTSRVVPANLGSPTTQRRGGCPSWPPKNSSVRELPKTGFSPSFVQERGSKQFVWPPPKPEDMVERGDTSPHITGHAGEAWHPQETPTASRPLVPRSPTPTRRSGDSIWPPRHTLVGDDTQSNRPMPKPVCRRGKFDDYVTHISSSNVPPTYRVPPGTVHVNFVF